MNPVHLKICGVRTPLEARQLGELKISYIGLNFIPSSRRLITIETAESIMAELHNSDSKTVGLFAGHSVETVNHYSQLLGLDYVQLHGNETADYAQKIKTPLVRAIAVDPDSSAYDLIRFIDSYPADYFVLDRPLQGQGDIINMELAKKVISARGDKIFLAGGLTPDNLKEVLTQVQPYGIDIAGGVRDHADNLDPDKVAECLKTIATL